MENKIMSLKTEATVQDKQRSVSRSVKLLAKDCRICKKNMWGTEPAQHLKTTPMSVTRQTNNVRFKNFLELKMVRGCESTWEVPYSFTQFLLLSRCPLMALVEERVLGQMNPGTAAFLFLAGLIRVLMHKCVSKCARQKWLIMLTDVYYRYFSDKYSSVLIAYNNAHCGKWCQIFTENQTLTFCWHK